ncbi:MAG TPA: hypothetical protein VNW53_12820 [Phenylobacterium sp.]|uniref:hypothetical protein n=1 Tax=Phenylobacterium sp. TaxID=1871053 RepID=UPI002B9584B2|nr:hypothetical protein [Phenylobacterium sp.]HXA39877.1 hypothetical protein [Phenylobacterium sp.]
MLVGAAGSSAALAQQPAAPQAIEITLLHVKPGQEQAFQDWVKNESNPLRIKGGVKDRETWTTTMGLGGEVYFVRPITGVSSYDTPPSGVSQAETAAVVAKRQSMILDLRTYLVTPRPELSVAPKPGYRPKLAVLSTQGVAPGHVSAYTTNLRALTAVIAKTNAKGVLVSQTGLGGDPNEFNVVVLFDSFADLDRFPAEFGKAATAAKLPPEAAGVVARTNYRVIRYQPELSIVPAR